MAARCSGSQPEQGACATATHPARASLPGKPNHAGPSAAAPSPREKAPWAWLQWVVLARPWVGISCVAPSAPAGSLRGGEGLRGASPERPHPVTRFCGAACPGPCCAGRGDPGPGLPASLDRGGGGGGGRIICCNSQAPTIAGGSSQAPSFGDQGGSPAGHPNPQTGGFLALLSLDAAPQHPTL